jgi:hypothetical protein
MKGKTVVWEGEEGEMKGRGRGDEGERKGRGRGEEGERKGRGRGAEGERGWHEAQGRQVGLRACSMAQGVYVAWVRAKGV